MKGREKEEIKRRRQEGREEFSPGLDLLDPLYSFLEGLKRV